MPAANLRQPLIPAWDVLLNGQALTAAEKAHVTRVAVNESLDAAGTVTLEFFEQLERSQQPTWLDNLSRFTPGGEIEIKMGYAGDIETLMLGDIMRLEPSFTSNQFRLTVIGFDRRHRLQRGRETQTFQQQKHSDIAAQIATKVGLTAETTDSQVTHDYVLQNNKTAWEFLSELAQSIKYEVLVEGKKLIFRPAANTDSAVLTLEMGADLLDFNPRLSVAGQVTEVVVRGWDPKEKKEVIGRAGLGEEEAPMGGERSGGVLVESALGTAVDQVTTPPVTSQAEADQRARALFNQRLLSQVVGNGSCFGRTDLRPGKVIGIAGVIQPFDGRYYVTQATQSYSQQSGYRTTFAVTRNAT